MSHRWGYESEVHALHPHPDEELRDALVRAWRALPGRLDAAEAWLEAHPLLCLLVIVAAMVAALS